MAHTRRTPPKKRSSTGVLFVLMCPCTRGLPASMVRVACPPTPGGAGPNVCHSLPLGSHARSEGLRVRPCTFRHISLALTPGRSGHSLLRSRLPMLWLPSSCKGERGGARGEHSIRSHHVRCAQSLPLKRRTDKMSRPRKEAIILRNSLLKEQMSNKMYKMIRKVIMVLAGKKV